MFGFFYGGEAHRAEDAGGILSGKVGIYHCLPDTNRTCQILIGFETF
jgi:hypothetical protein